MAIRDRRLTRRGFPSSALRSCSPGRDAQRADAPRPGGAFRVSTPRVILEHVQIIDGTAAPNE
jgi:hypothetical protein